MGGESVRVSLRVAVEFGFGKFRLGFFVMGIGQMVERRGALGGFRTLASCLLDDNALVVVPSSVVSWSFNGTRFDHKRGKYKI